MNYKEDKEVLGLVGHANEKGFNLTEDNFVSKFDFGSTYQGMADEFSDKDVCYLYFTNLEEFLFTTHKARSKHLDDYDARVMPLHQMYFFIKKHSVDSYLILNAQLENGSAELNDKVFSLFYDENKYNRLVKGNMLKTVGSLAGNINTINRNVNNQGFTGKSLIKYMSFLEVFHRVEKGNVSYKTMSKASPELKGIIHIKRKTEEELRELNYNEINYFKKLNVSNFKEMNEYINEEHKRLLDLKEKIVYNSDLNGENYSDDELLNPLKESILELYKQHYKK